jgi:hypothetical protein
VGSFIIIADISISLSFVVYNTSTACGFPCAFDMNVTVNMLLRSRGVAPVQFGIAESKTAYNPRDIRVSGKIRASFNDENALKEALLS